MFSFTTSGTAMTAVVLIVIFMFLLIKPEHGLFIAIIASSIYNPTVLPFPGMKIYLNHMLLILLFVCYFYKTLIHPGKAFHHSPLDLALITYTIFALMSLSTAQDMTMAYKRLLAFFLYAIPYFLCANILTNRELLKKFINAITISGTVAVLIGYVALVYAPFQGTVYRMTGAYHNPNALGAVLINFLPILLTAAMAEKALWLKILRWGAFVFCISGLIMTFSRGAWLGLASALVLLWMISRKRILLIIFILPLSLFSFFIALHGFEGEARLSAPTFDDQSLKARMVLWQSAVRVAVENPFTGVGIGNFVASAKPYDSKNFNGAFNNYITSLAELGVGGMASLLLFHLGFLVLIMKQIQSGSSDTYYRYILTGVFAAVFGSMVHGLFEDLMFNTIINWVPGAFTGAAVAIGRLYKSENNQISEETPPVKRNRLAGINKNILKPALKRI